MKPKLIVEQQITAFTNKYDVYLASPGGSKDKRVAFAQQKRLAFREKVTFFADDAKTQVAFTFRAEKVLDVHGRYLVEDPSGALLGSFKKVFGRSLLNSTWQIFGEGDQPKIEITESNQFLAIMRRFGGYIPIVGGLVDIVMLFFKYHFVFTYVANKQEVGQYHKTTLLRDHYALSMTDEAYSEQDWRVLAAMAVALDALQSR